MKLFKKIQSLLSDPQPHWDPGRDLSLAKAVVLIEIAEYDEDFQKQERDLIFTLLQNEFHLTEDEVNILFAEAQKFRKDNPDIFYSTRQLNALLSVEEKQDFMVQAWKVVLADGKIDYSEDVLTRKLIQLLRLDRSAWIQTRDRAMQEIGELNDKYQ